MADQENWPNIFIDHSAGVSGDGSELSPYNKFSDLSWETGTDNSIFDHYAVTPTASVTINLKRGVLAQDASSFVSEVDATAAYPVVIRGYGTGDKPHFDGAIDISTASYKWTLSQGGTKEYFLEAAAGGDPGIDQTKQAFIDGVRCYLGGPSTGMSEVGSLIDHEFVWGHNIADEAVPNSKVNYDTVYLRDDDGNPDVTGALIECSRGVKSAMFYLAKSYYTIDGIHTSRENGQGVRAADRATNITIKNHLSHYDYWSLSGYGGCHDFHLIDCEVSFSVGAGIGISGTEEEPVRGFRIEGCTVHDSAYKYAGLGFWEAAGTKLFALYKAVITRNTWYNNPGGGIRLDGLSIYNPLGGCRYCEISENLLINNGPNWQMGIEFSEHNEIRHNFIHSHPAGTDGIAVVHSMSDSNKVWGNIIAGGNLTGGAGIRLMWNAGDGDKPNFIYNNIITNHWQGIVAGVEGGAILRNNITIGCGTDLKLSTGGGASLDSDYNCWSKGGVGSIAEDGSGAKTLAVWQTYAGTDLNSISDDPQIEDIDNNKFWLKSTSPCINIGEDKGSPYYQGLLSGSVWPDNVLIGDQGNF